MIEYFGGMRKNRRIIRDDYTGLCSACGEWKSYDTEFYLYSTVYAFEDRPATYIPSSHRAPGVPIRVANEVEYFNRFSSKCKECSKTGYSKSPLKAGIYKRDAPEVMEHLSSLDRPVEESGLMLSQWIKDNFHDMPD